MSEWQIKLRNSKKPVILMSEATKNLGKCGFTGKNQVCNSEALPEESRNM